VPSSIPGEQLGTQAALMPLAKTKAVVLLSLVLTTTVNLVSSSNLFTRMKALPIFLNFSNFTTRSVTGKGLEAETAGERFNEAPGLEGTGAVEVDGDKPAF
jgi:hypothetical protein